MAIQISRTFFHFATSAVTDRTFRLRLGVNTVACRSLIGFTYRCFSIRLNVYSQYFIQSSSISEERCLWRETIAGFTCGEFSLRPHVCSRFHGCEKKFPEADNIPYACTSVADGGTGLGLAVVFGVVKSHRGFIDVESEIRHGTTFRLYFPIPPGFKEEGAITMQEEEQTKTGNELILLVEDEEILRELVKSSLEEKGYRVIEAGDGTEAVETFRARKNEIALVLCDMGLPKIGGWDAFQMMRQVKPDVSIIFASGYLDPALKAEIIKDGAKDFVQKPYEPEAIVKRIREVIDGK